MKEDTQLENSRWCISWSVCKTEKDSWDDWSAQDKPSSRSASRTGRPPTGKPTVERANSQKGNQDSWKDWDDSSAKSAKQNDDWGKW